MKDFSFFLLKNSIGAKMRKGFRSSCNGDGSTSTLNQRKMNGVDYSCIAAQSVSGSPFVDATSGQETRTTLEEMILQLEFEEKMARKAKVDDHEYNSSSGAGAAAELMEQRRMSCVDNADILRSARNALNQYPRFSLDGKDAMYRSSFQNLPPISTAAAAAAGSRKSFCCSDPRPAAAAGLRRKGIRIKEGGLINSEVSWKTRCFPPIVGGESVVWCKPGVVAKLMGLEAVPIPVRSCSSSSTTRKDKWSSVIIKQQQQQQQNRRKRAERHELMERRRSELVRDINGGNEIKEGRMSSCSRTGY